MCSRRALPAFPTASCGSVLHQCTSTEHERRLDDFGPLLVALPLERAEAVPVVSGNDL